MIQFPLIAEQPPPGSGSLPDANTSEAILYGKSYPWIKSALWVWDEMEDYLLKKANALESQILDREWAFNVMRYNRYLIFAKSPPVNEVNHLRDLMTLRSLCKCISGIQKINQYRNHNLAWARMRGIGEYVSSMAGRGISEAEWKAATASFNMKPITFESVHGNAPDMYPEEDIDWTEAMINLMGEEAYNALRRKILGEENVEDAVMRQINGEFDMPQELERTESDSLNDEFWHSLYEALEIMFAIPSEEAMESLSDTEDECSLAADYWEDMDVDSRGVIDSLIEFAMELT